MIMVRWFESGMIIVPLVEFSFFVLIRSLSQFSKSFSFFLTLICAHTLYLSLSLSLLSISISISISSCACDK